MNKLLDDNPTKEREGEIIKIKHGVLLLDECDYN